MLGNAGDNNPNINTGIHLQLQKFVGALNPLRLQYRADADVHRRKVVIGDHGLHRQQLRFLRHGDFCNSSGGRCYCRHLRLTGCSSGQCSFPGLVCLFGFEEFIHLKFHLRIFNFPEKKARFLQLLTGLYQVCVSNGRPRQGFAIQVRPQLLHGKGKERLEQNGQVGGDLQTNVQDGRHPRGIRREELPRLGFRQVLVAQAGQVHGLAQRLPDPECLEALLNPQPDAADLVECGLVIVGNDAPLRTEAIKIFLGQNQRAVHEISEHGNQLIVVPGLKILPREVVVLGLRCIGSQHIAKHILHAGKFFEVFVQPDGPVPRSGYLVPLEVQEFVGRHIVGKDVFAVRLEHGRKNNAVEHDIVLADKVNHPAIF